jgi:hypothetical protein
MKSQFSTAREFVKCAARFSDLVYVLSKGKTLMAQDIAHTSLIAVDDGAWADAVDTEWNSTAIAVAKLPSEKVIVVGEDGDVAAYVGGKTVSEKLFPMPIMIRNAKDILGHVYACGMKRQVYKRIDEGKWVDISALPGQPTESTGFESIDGFSETEIYAVGWNGEIWQYDSTKWHQHGGFTNLILNAVLCAEEGVVYIAGQQGTLIKGRNDSWEQINFEDEVSVDFWDLCWFKNKLYVATMSNLYTLEGNKLVSVDFGNIAKPSCYSLSAADGVLWSVGRDDVVSFDGVSWKSYD